MSTEQPKLNTMEELCEAIIKAKQKPLIQQKIKTINIIGNTKECSTPFYSEDPHAFYEQRDSGRIWGEIKREIPEILESIPHMSMAQSVIDCLEGYEDGLSKEIAKIEENWAWTPENISGIFESRVLYPDNNNATMINNLLLAEAQHPKIFAEITPKLRSEVNGLYISASQSRALEHNITVNMRSTLSEKHNAPLKNRAAVGFTALGSALTLLAVSVFSGNDNEAVAPAPQTAQQEITHALRL